MAELHLQPMEDPTLYPREGTQDGTVGQELQPMGSTHIGEVHGGLSPMGETQWWSRGGVRGVLHMMGRKRQRQSVKK